MIRRRRVIGTLLVVVVAASALLQADAGSDEVKVEPRIVEATLGRVSLEQVDLSLRVALRASEAATIRSIAFTDAFVGRVPVWVERIEGSWPLAPGRELIIPTPLEVRMHVRDALGTDDLGAIVRKGSVTVRSSVEVAIETPRLARLFFMGSTRTLVRDVVLELPIGGGATSPLTRVGADLADVAQRGAASWITAGLDRLSGRGRIASRFSGVVASVSTRYALDDGARPAERERRAAGVWWTPGVFCTTREALAPWRFDVTDATALQLGAGRLRTAGGVVRIGATRDRPAIDVDLAAVEEVLPAPRERRLYTLVGGRRERLRLGDRDAASNLVCLQVGASAQTRLAPASSGPSLSASGDVAAFSPGASLGVVWTAVAASRGDRLELATPLYRASFGSPLVSGDRIVGLVASATTAWPAAVVESAAARAPRLTVLEGSLH
jgi:hypothetical protein